MAFVGFLRLIHPTGPPIQRSYVHLNKQNLLFPKSVFYSLLEVLVTLKAHLSTQSIDDACAQMPQCPPHSKDAFFQSGTQKLAHKDVSVYTLSKGGHCAHSPPAFSSRILSICLIFQVAAALAFFSFSNMPWTLKSKGFCTCCPICLKCPSSTLHLLPLSMHVPNCCSCVRSQQK